MYRYTHCGDKAACYSCIQHSDNTAYYRKTTISILYIKLSTKQFALANIDIAMEMDYFSNSLHLK